MFLVIEDGWTPTPANIEELPLPLRRYIIELQSNNTRETAQLRKELSNLKRDMRLRAGITDDIPK